MGDTIVLAREMFSSGCLPRKRACLSSQVTRRFHRLSKGMAEDFLSLHQGFFYMDAIFCTFYFK